jgi:hypothetical protein
MSAAFATRRPRSRKRGRTVRPVSRTSPTTTMRREACARARKSSPAISEGKVALNSSRITQAPFGKNIGHMRPATGWTFPIAAAACSNGTPQHTAVAKAASTEASRCSPGKLDSTWVLSLPHRTRKFSRSGHAAETWSARTALASEVPKVTTRAAQRSAMASTRGSSAFKIAVPRLPSRLNSWAFSAVMSSSVGKASEWTRRTRSTTTTSGAIIQAARRNAPGARVPTSITVKRWRNRVLSTMRDSTERVFLPPGRQFVGKCAERTEPRHAAAVLLPALPVMAINVVRNIKRRHTSAAALAKYS